MPERGVGAAVTGDDGVGADEEGATIMRDPNDERNKAELMAATTAAKGASSMAPGGGDLASTTFVVPPGLTAAATADDSVDILRGLPKAPSSRARRHVRSTTAPEISRAGGGGRALLPASRQKPLVKLTAQQQQQHRALQQRERQRHFHRDLSESDNLAAYARPGDVFVAEFPDSWIERGLQKVRAMAGGDGAGTAGVRAVDSNGAGDADGSMALALASSRGAAARLEQKNAPSMAQFGSQCSLMWQWSDAEAQRDPNWFGTVIIRLLPLLDPRQLYFIAGLVVIKQYKDFVGLLPLKLARRIFDFLSVRDLVSASQVCRRWHEVANDNQLWYRKCRQRITFPIEGCSSAVLREPIQWKAVYMEQAKLKRNLLSSKYNVRTFSQHTNRVLSVTMDATRIVSGSVDRTVKVWSIKTGEVLHNLRGHKRGVWCVQLYLKNTLVSGSFDAAIIVWNLVTGTIERTLTGHRQAVWCLRVGSRKSFLVASGSCDSSIKLWEGHTGYCRRTLLGHHSAVYCLELDEPNNMLYSGSGDKTVRVWNTESGVCLHEISLFTNAVMCLSLNNGILAAGSWDTIYLVRPRESEVLRKLTGHYGRVEDLSLKQAKVNSMGRITGVVVSASRDKTLRKWDLSTGRCIQAFRGHTGSVNALAFESMRIASASDDHSLKVWEMG